MSRITNERLAEMLAGLEGVMPGPWDVKTHEEWEEGFDFFSGPENTFTFRADVEPEDAAHIARCDPDTIRTLITELQSLRSPSPAPEASDVVAKLQKLIDDFHIDMQVELANAEETGERPDLWPEEIDTPVRLLVEAAVTLTSAQARERELVEEVEQLRKDLAAQLAGHQETARQSTENLMRANTATAKLDEVEARARKHWQEFRDLRLDIIGHGPMCRDCADENGRCPSSGQPCDPDEAVQEKITNWKAAEARLAEAVKVMEPFAHSADFYARDGLNDAEFIVNVSTRNKAGEEVEAVLTRRSLPHRAQFPLFHERHEP